MRLGCLSKTVKRGEIMKAGLSKQKRRYFSIEAR